MRSKGGKERRKGWGEMQKRERKEGDKGGRRTELRRRKERERGKEVREKEEREKGGPGVGGEEERSPVPTLAVASSPFRRGKKRA